jgi:hypothetical protein
MKKMNMKSLSILALLVMAFTVSCKKEKDMEFNQIRMFTPGNIGITTADTTVTLEWNPSLFTEGRNVTYTVEVARDSSFQNVVYRTVVDTSKAVITASNLSVRTNYVARVKADTSGNIPQSYWVISGRFAMTGEQIFLPVQATDIIDVAVLLKWRTTAGLTKIVLTPQNGTPMDIALTAGDITAERKLITGLTSNTQYTAEIFAGTRSKGLVTFRTKVPMSGNIIDLRGISGRPTVLVDTLPIIPSGSIVVLGRGQTYTVSVNTPLSKSVTIVSGDDLLNPNLAMIYFTSNFNFTASAAIDSIKFSNVAIRSDNYTSRYIFNTTGGATLSKMIFENCRIGAFRGLVRLQSGTTTVSEFRLDNCVVDSLGNYGVITVDNVSCRVDRFVLRNSTVYKADKIITSRQNSTSILVESCTFNETPLGGGATSNFFIDYSQSGTNNVTAGIAINNTIFGVGKANSGNSVVRGIRVNAATGITVANSYKTSDYVTAGNDIPSLVAYPGTSAQLFQDPNNGNFTIIDNSFAGRNTAGDPRWR